MTTPIIPNSVVADGNVRVGWAPAVANIAVPALGELNAAGAVDLTCYLNVWTPGTEEAKINDNRLCTAQSIERLGRVSESLEGGYIWDPQNATPAQNQAYNTLKPGTLGFLVWRGGLDSGVAWAIGQKVDVFPVTCGQQRRKSPEENSVYGVLQQFGIRGAVRRDATVAA